MRQHRFKNKISMNIIQLINTKPRLITISILLLLVPTSNIQAKDYMVEVLVFENNIEARATESHEYTAPREMKFEAETWELESSMLLEQAQAIVDSSDYELVHHFSWGQESLPYEDSATFNVYEDKAQGFIKIYAEQLLFANIDLDYDGYRMQEKRRLKLNEKHFFDHPKFGLLLQVSRLEVEEEELELEQEAEGAE